MDLIERFRYIMKLNNLTASAFADSIGVQPSSISHILSGRNKPSLEFIQKIIKAYPKVDPGWLINGNVKPQNGERSFDSTQIEQTKTGLNVENVSDAQNNQLKKQDRLVEKVLLFYSDGTFEEFKSAVFSEKFNKN